MMCILKHLYRLILTECNKYNSTNTKQREKILEKILTPTGFEPASPRLSRPGSLSNSPTEVPYVSDNFKSSYYVHTRSTWLLNILSDSQHY